MNGLKPTVLPIPSKGEGNFPDYRHCHSITTPLNFFFFFGSFVSFARTNIRRKVGPRLCFIFRSFSFFFPSTLFYLFFQFSISYFSFFSSFFSPSFLNPFLAFRRAYCCPDWGAPTCSCHSGCVWQIRSTCIHLGFPCVISRCALVHVISDYSTFLFQSFSHTTHIEHFPSTIPPLPSSHLLDVTSLSFLTHLNLISHSPLASPLLLSILITTQMSRHPDVDPLRRAHYPPPPEADLSRQGQYPPPPDDRSRAYPYDQHHYPVGPSVISGQPRARDEI